ncbi:hypothetical protein CW731_09140 [Polaribacter sp. ALD11]|uniref:TolB family protein n=1 Tax=Polaribacter sp. ALD11 TaxID=2058137 RepID=UPI000C304B24|nr:PD40 domain-containing protein [Polaribacter sp. ALD11]AUC85441.1 hypothetical protein CW731_09140 [Polaribacter sp. ALD11]
MKNFKFLVLFVFILGSCNTSKKIELPNLSVEKTTDSLEIFGKNIISTSLFERDFALSPNRDEIIHTLGEYKQKRRFLVHLKKENKTWSKPKVMNISGEHQDIEPFFSVDGKQLFFASNRPLKNNSNRKDYNIWVSKKEGNKWSTPIALDTLINTEKDEFYPSVSANGNLYFTAVRKDGIGTEDIFVANYVHGKYQKPKVLSKNINTKTYEFNAFVNPDENLLIFSSFGRKDGFGGGDLYFSTKDENGDWQKAKNMGEKINSTSLDFCPFYDAKTKNLYFSSERSSINQKKYSIESLVEYANSIENGMSNIYRVKFDTNDK